MRPELIGTSRGTKVYWVDNPEDCELYDDIVIDRRTYIAFYKGYVIGSLAHGAGSFQTFDEDKFYKLKKGIYKEKVEPVEEKLKKKKEAKVAMAAEPTPTPTSSLLDAGNEVEAMLKSVKDYCGVAVLGDEVFADLARELEALMG